MILWNKDWFRNQNQIQSGPKKVDVFEWGYFWMGLLLYGITLYGATFVWATFVGLLSLGLLCFGTVECLYLL